MIQTMKHVTIVCLDAQRNQAAKAMQKQGTVHLIPGTQTFTPSEELSQANQKLEQINQALAILAKRETPKDQAEAKEMEPEQALKATLKALQDCKQADQDIQQANQELKLLEPWGSFQAQQLKDLAGKGLHVVLCSAPEKSLENLQLPQDAVLQKISVSNGTAAFAVISQDSLEDGILPRATLPERTDRNLIQQQILTAQTAKNQAEELLDTLAAQHMEAIRGLLPEAQDHATYAQARDSMGKDNLLAYVTGYVPEDRLDDLLACARKNGWAVRYESIKEDDTDVPTLLKIPKRFSMSKWILDFVGILPGYFETDASISIYIFLSIFCGMLIGDAGYGAILSAIAGYFLLKAKGEEAKNGLKVLLSMSVCTFLFGWITGNWFGIDPTRLPAIMAGLPWLSQDSTQTHIKLLCFFIGAFHTSLAHAWLAYNQRKSIRDVIGNLGWALFLWANFFAASKIIAGGIPGTDAVMYAFYGIGFVAILTCSINWKDLGEVIYSPFSFINSFVDILSYIRLFAVGLSGVYIAQSFNGMVASIWDISPFLIPVAILVLLVGHLLNIAMAAMSILVHGVRLNTLEFSGHMGLTWSGKAYKPLKLTKDNQ